MNHPILKKPSRLNKDLNLDDKEMTLGMLDPDQL